jgi:hypothetical protein
MGEATKKTRTALYAALGLGGTSDWASDLQKYNDVPTPADGWDTFRKLAKAGDDPKVDHSRNGNWTDFDCEHKMIIDSTWYTLSNKWKTLNGDAAWADVVRIWKDVDRKRHEITFMQSLTTTLHMGEGANWHLLNSDSCIKLDFPNGANSDTSGPAAQFVWNSLAQIHFSTRTTTTLYSRPPYLASQPWMILRINLHQSLPKGMIHGSCYSLIFSPLEASGLRDLSSTPPSRSCLTSWRNQVPLTTPRTPL